MKLFLSAMVGFAMCGFSLDVRAVSFDSNVPANIKQQMIDDLAFMASIQGGTQTPLHQQIYGSVSGDAYKNFFETRVKGVGMNSCGGGMAVACVIPFLNPNKMWLTQNFVKFSHPQIARSMVVYHEARHTESRNGNWGHDTCPSPFLDENGKSKKSIWTGAELAGQPACDSTAFGSYGSSTIMLKNISKFCANCNEKVKMDADIYSTDQLGRIDRDDVKKQMLEDFNGGKNL
ncbi:MAG: hypothetical protein BroJett041_23880 [Candidatus Jettenia caeni]|nr:MAG: hypothetical protein BroJett041_23880 [Candidatus Jettenia caeni]